MPHARRKYQLSYVLTWACFFPPFPFFFANPQGSQIIPLFSSWECSSGTTLEAQRILIHYAYSSSSKKSCREESAPRALSSFSRSRWLHSLRMSLVRLLTGGRQKRDGFLDSSPTSSILHNLSSLLAFCRELPSKGLPCSLLQADKRILILVELSVLRWLSCCRKLSRGFRESTFLASLNRFLLKVSLDPLARCCFRGVSIVVRRFVAAGRLLTRCEKIFSGRAEGRPSMCSTGADNLLGNGDLCDPVLCFSSIAEMEHVIIECQQGNQGIVIRVGLNPSPGHELNLHGPTGLGQHFVYLVFGCVFKHPPSPHD